MAEFLTTSDISARLQKIIREADERLVLISPYLQVNPKIKELLAQKARSKTHIRVIYGKKALKPEEREWLDSLTSIEVCFRQNLHAKCYLNEKEAILTSMNLYQFSEQNNDEMGILVSNDLWNDRDRQLYSKIYQEAENIADLSEKEHEVPKSEQVGGLAKRLLGAAKGTFSKKVEGNTTSEPTSAVDYHDARTSDTDETPKDNFRRDSGSKPAVVPADPVLGIPTTGFCIRCKAVLTANPTQPYCNGCYRVWNRYKNEEYEEKHCHTCGNEHTATLLKPLCSTCYRKYKDVFEFAVS